MVSDLIGNVFHSLSSATTAFKGNANITITKLLNPGEEENGLPQSMKFLIGIMESYFFEFPLFLFLSFFLFQGNPQVPTFRNLWITLKYRTP